MPGKQMSIDAELNAGLIERDEAKRRRSKIEREADFYGAMDGASKFVRGDAIAGIIITLINVVVGLIIGVLQHNLSFQESAQIFYLAHCRRWSRLADPGPCYLHRCRYCRHKSRRLYRPW